MPTTLEPARGFLLEVLGEEGQVRGLGRRDAERRRKSTGAPTGEKTWVRLRGGVGGRLDAEPAASDRRIAGKSRAQRVTAAGGIEPAKHNQRRDAQRRTRKRFVAGATA